MFAWEDADGESSKKLSPSTTGYHAPKSLEGTQNPLALGFTAGAGHKSPDFAACIHQGLCEGRESGKFAVAATAAASDY